jgi:RNA polymerase sigma factor (sigma-70 family)
MSHQCRQRVCIFEETMMIDPLVCEYVRDRSPDAFRALVERYGPAVLAQCRRELRRDSHMAEDVTQAVFIVLMRKATGLSPNVVLPAWLFKVTRYACANVKRGEARRVRHETEAVMMRELQQQDGADAEAGDLNEVIDGALSRLGRVDRDVIILRFYSGMNSTEVAAVTGMSIEATRRRTSRAMEKLRDMLTGTAAGLAPAVLLQGLERLSPAPALPVHLTKQLAMLAIHPATTTASCATVAKATLHMMRWAKIKIGVAAALAVAATTAAVGETIKHAMIASPAPAVQASPINPAPQSVAAPAAPAAPAAAQDAAVDQELIRVVVGRLAQAIRADDLKTVDQCMFVSNDDAGQLAKAMILENVAYRHLQTAWAAAFHRPVGFQGFVFVWLPDLDGGAEIVLERALANLSDADIQFNGNSARFPMKFAAPGAKVSPSLDFLRGGWVTLVNPDGAGWKIDASRTLRVNVSMTFLHGRQPSSGEEELKIALRQKQEVVGILESAAQAIEKGELTKADAASARVVADVGAMQTRLGLAGIGYSLAPAMPTSVEQAK